MAIIILEKLELLCFWEKLKNLREIKNSDFSTKI